MNTQISTDPKDTDTKFKNIKRITQKIESLQYKLDSLCDEVALDIKDGWSTGDKLLDFVLLACDGNYDQFVISMQYRSLYDLGIRRPNQKIMVVQKGEYYDDYEGVIIIRNIYIAQLRKAVIDFDLNNLCFKIPVEANFFCWREFINKDGEIISRHKLITGEWLLTGPIHNKYCNYSQTDENGNIIYLSEVSVCNIELLPAKDLAYLFLNYGIDSESLNQFTQTWIREKTRLINKK